jgi:hypothetical protein
MASVVSGSQSFQRIQALDSRDAFRRLFVPGLKKMPEFPGVFSHKGPGTDDPRIGEIAGPAEKPVDRKSTRLNSSHNSESRMPSSA